MARLTNDRGPPEVPIFTVKEIGRTRKLLPNGSLLCEAVPIARTGWMLYGPGEVPLQPGPTGTIYVERTEEELFRPETVGSFIGSPVVLDHPDSDDGVTPENYRELAGGVATNLRRGEGPDADVLLADLIISRKDLIDAVLKGKVEVSCGYDADYVQTAPGEGKQQNIIGNHIALVDKGRCGPRCAIGDRLPINLERESLMTTKAGAKQRRRIDAAGLASLSQAIAGAVAEHLGDEDEEEGVNVHVHMHTKDADGCGADPDKKVKDAEGDPEKKKEPEDVGARMDRIEKTVDTIAKTVDTLGQAMKAMSGDRRKAKDAEEGEEGEEGDEGEEDDVSQDKKKKGTKDSATEGSDALAKSWQDMVSKCEVLVPGFKLPTFDAAAARKITVDRMCAQRRRVLDVFSTTKEGAELLTSITGEAECDLAKMDCAAVAVTFNAAAAAKAASNNRSATGDSARVPSSGAQEGVDAPAFVSPASINEANRKFWENRSA